MGNLASNKDQDLRKKLNKNTNLRRNGKEKSGKKNTNLRRKGKENREFKDEKRQK